MIVHETLLQGSDEWKAARLGKPTASRFDRILTPAKAKPVSGKARDAFIAELCAEWALGHPLDDMSSGFMERGLEFEDAARLDYEFTVDPEIHTVGFVTNDDATVGYSPDAFVGEQGLWENKTPSAKVHVGYMLDPDSLVAKYRHQVQGGLYVSERAWCDLESYHPTLPKVIVRVEPDAAWQSALSREVPLFLERLAAAKDKLRELGVSR